MTCSPKLPKSLAAQYNKKYFQGLNEEQQKAQVVFYDEKFKPSISDDGWCTIRADLTKNKEKQLEIPSFVAKNISCGFDIRVPAGHEFYFRPVFGSLWFLADASNVKYTQRRVVVTLFNFSESDIAISHGDILGEVCVRPINNISISLEIEE